MSHAEKCPVCMGEGQITKPGDLNSSAKPTDYTVSCHGCGGSGWVTVQDAFNGWEPYVSPWYNWTASGTSEEGFTIKYETSQGRFVHFVPPVEEQQNEYVIVTAGAPTERWPAPPIK